MLELFRQCWTGKIQFHSPFVPTQPSPTPSPSPSGSLSISPLADAVAFCLFAFPATQRKFTSQSELGREAAAAAGGAAWRWLINSGAYVCPQWEAELFILWLPCASFHSTGAQCWQHLTIFFLVHQRLLLNLMSVSRTSSSLPDSVARTASQVFLIVKITLKNIF